MLLLDERRHELPTGCSREVDAELGELQAQQPISDNHFPLARRLAY
jgi:hypothetical protein